MIISCHWAFFILVDRKRELSSSVSLNEMMICGNSEFEMETNRMSVTDLDLVQYALQAEMKLLQGQLAQLVDEDEAK